MRTEMLAKAFDAGGTIPKHTIVKPHTVAGQVVVGAASTDKLIGVSTEVDVAAGGRVDVHLCGIVDVLYGGTVAAGDLLTSDANGHAIATTTENDRVIGLAMVAGVDDDIGCVFLAPSII